jgi:hypothetical protein
VITDKKYRLWNGHFSLKLIVFCIHCKDAPLKISSPRQIVFNEENCFQLLFKKIAGEHFFVFPSILMRKVSSEGFPAYLKNFLQMQEVFSVA